LKVGNKGRSLSCSPTRHPKEPIMNKPRDLVAGGRPLFWRMDQLARSTRAHNHTHSTCQNRTRAASSRLSQAPRLLLPRAWTGRRVRLQPTAIASDGDERPFCPPQPECDAATADHDLANERARPLLAACGCDQLKVTAHRFHSLLRQSRDGVAVQQRHYPTT
jgi:hypothetical protein